MAVLLVIGYLLPLISLFAVLVLGVYLLTEGGIMLYRKMQARKLELAELSKVES